MRPVDLPVKNKRGLKFRRARKVAMGSLVPQTQLCPLQNPTWGSVFWLDSFKFTSHIQGLTFTFSNRSGI